MNKPEILDDIEIIQVCGGMTDAFLTEDGARKWLEERVKLITRQRDDTFRKTLKQFLQWGNESCPHLATPRLDYPKRYCRECWQALKAQLD